MQIGFTLRSIQYYGDTRFMKPIVHVWCKKMLGGKKTCIRLPTEVQSVVG